MEIRSNWMQAGFSVQHRHCLPHTNQAGVLGGLWCPSKTFLLTLPSITQRLLLVALLAHFVPLEESSIRGKDLFATFICLKFSDCKTNELQSFGVFSDILYFQRGYIFNRNNSVWLPVFSGTVVRYQRFPFSGKFPMAVLMLEEISTCDQAVSEEIRQ